MEEPIVEIFISSVEVRCCHQGFCGVAKIILCQLSDATPDTEWGR